MLNNRIQSCGSACPWCQFPEPLGENPPAAPSLVAIEPARKNNEPDHSSTSGQIRQAAMVATMNTKRRPPTVRANTAPGHRANPDGGRISFCLYAFRSKSNRISNAGRQPRMPLIPFPNPRQYKQPIPSKVSQSQSSTPKHRLIFETHVERVHVEDAIMLLPFPNRVDPDFWQSWIMSFQQFYGLAFGRLQSSRLSLIPEEQYGA